MMSVTKISPTKYFAVLFTEYSDLKYVISACQGWCRTVLQCNSQVHVNGLVTFNRPFLDYQPKVIPTDVNVPMFAVFWADIEMKFGPGIVFYQEHNRYTDDEYIDPLFGTDRLIFAKATTQVQQVLGDTGFIPTNVIVITWQAVSPYPSSTTQNEVSNVKSNFNGKFN
jgi:hypothetical protein